MPEDLPTIEDLLPHRGPMRLLDAVTRWLPEGVTCRAVVRPDNPFVRGGYLQEVAHLELLAQGAAAHITLSDSLRRPVRGYLVAARDLTFVEASRVPLGTELEIEVREAARLGAFASYEGEVRHRGQVLARGSVRVYRREDGE